MLESGDGALTQAGARMLATAGAALQKGGSEKSIMALQGVAKPLLQLMEKGPYKTTKAAVRCAAWC